MRQQANSNVPETDDLYPLSIQKGADDRWYVYDLRTGGKVSIPLDTYKAAEVIAKSWKDFDVSKVKELSDYQEI